MAKRRSVVWTPSLHPRDPAGKFTKSPRSAARAARRDGRRPLDEAAAKERRKLNRRANLRAARGIAVGGATAYVGYKTGSRKHIAAGAGRAGLAVAEARHNRKSARRVTSREFAGLSAADKQRELTRRRRVSGGFAVAGAASDAALVYSAGKRGKAHVDTFRKTRAADANFKYNRTLVDHHKAGLADTARFYERKKKTGALYKNTAFQGPVPSRARAKGTKGPNAGVYNITTGNIGGISQPKASAMKRAATKAAGKVGQSTFVRRRASDAGVKAADAALKAAKAKQQQVYATTRRRKR